MRTIYKIRFAAALFVLFLSPSLWQGPDGLLNAAEQPVSFSQSDRDRLLYDIDKRLIRMEAILEQHDKRFQELRADMNLRFEATDKRFEELRNDMNQRFGWLIALFVAITSVTIGFAIWDRRTMIRPFGTKVKEINIVLEQLRREKTANKILSVLRELAKKDIPLAELLRTYNLL